jgi:hypothetical protein
MTSATESIQYILLYSVFEAFSFLGGLCRLFLLTKPDGMIVFGCLVRLYLRFIYLEHTGVLSDRYLGGVRRVEKSELERFEFKRTERGVLECDCDSSW